MKKSFVITAGLVVLYCCSAYGVTLDGVAVLNDHKQMVDYVVFSRDGKRMASCSEDNMVYIWDTVHWKHTGTLRSEDEPLAAAFSPDGSKLYVADHDNRLSRWDADSGARETNEKIGCAVNDIKINNDGKSLAIACDGKRLFIWNMAENRMEKMLKGHKDDVMAVDFSSDGSKLVSGGKDCQAIVWSTTEWTNIQMLTGHKEDILGVALSPDGEKAATTSNDKKIFLWDLKSGQKVVELAKNDQEGDRAIAWHPSGKFLFTVQGIPAVNPAVTDACQMVAIDPASGQVLASAPVACNVNHLTVSPDGSRVVVASREIAIFSVGDQPEAPNAMKLLPPTVNP